MSALDDIIKWAQSLPDWQGDAIRRLLQQGELTDNDRAEIYQMVKVAAGIEKECVAPVAPRIGDISGTRATMMPISLQRISQIQHVNAVENGSTIPFGHEGMTVIYGENGSGKSSYARILKRACRARDTKESILPNVFDITEIGPATATMRISEGGSKDIDLPWTDGEPADDRLASITFFDSKCARVIVDDNNEATYIPYGCEVFDSLVRLVKNVRERLQSEKPAPVELRNSNIVEGTDAHVFLKNLSRGTKSSDIDAATHWTDAEEQELSSTIARIAQSGSAQLTTEAERLESTAKRAKRLAELLTTAIAGLDETVVSQIDVQLDAVTAATRAADLAAQSTLRNEPLPSGAPNEWKLLYEAAREYSTKIAYPNSAFPAIGKDDLCVLCQQVMDDDARERLLRFKRFMEDKSEEALRSAKSNLRGITERIKALDVPRVEDFENVLRELDDANRKGVESTIADLQKEKVRLLSVKADSKRLGAGREFDAHQDGITDLVRKLGERAAQARKDADPAALKSLGETRDKLASKKSLAQMEKDVRTYVSQRQVEFKYDQMIRSLNTRPISEKGKAVISTALSPQLRSDLAAELERLNAKHLPLSVSITGREGGARHQIALNAATRAKPSDILSEGELGVVAVAGFMAELGGAPTKSPIIFDDPVSSLDHQYSRQIAQRLVDEARHRQVIVFTHNIAFLVEIEKRCAGIPLTVQTVKRFGTTPGKCMEGLPWEAMPVKSRLAYLENEFNEIAKHHDVDDEKYNGATARIYGLIRESWEAFVEHDLLNATVKRHDTDIRTRQLMRVEVLDEDCKRIDEGMSKCSEWMTGHDKSRALSVKRPAPSEVRGDIDALRKFVSEMHARHDAVRKRRNAILKPRTSELG